MRLMDHVSVIFWQKNHWCGVLFIGLPNNNFEYIWHLSQFSRILWVILEIELFVYSDRYSKYKSTEYMENHLLIFLSILHNHHSWWMLALYNNECLCLITYKQYAKCDRKHSIIFLYYIISVFFFDAHVWWSDWVLVRRLWRQGISHTNKMLKYWISIGPHYRLICMQIPFTV